VATFDARKDFAADARLLGIAAAAALVGILSTGAAYDRERPAAF
jgi:hypothetical protein